MDLYQYAIVRNDIHIPTGKSHAMAGHAFVNAILKTSKHIVDLYQGDKGIGTKVVLQGSIDDILAALEHCKEVNIPYDLVIDSGHICLPDFDGSPVVAALGISPVSELPII